MSLGPTQDGVRVNGGSAIPASTGDDPTATPAGLLTYPPSSPGYATQFGGDSPLASAPPGDAALPGMVGVVIDYSETQTVPTLTPVGFYWLPPDWVTP